MRGSRTARSARQNVLALGVQGANQYGEELLNELVSSNWILFPHLLMISDPVSLASYSREDFATQMNACPLVTTEAQWI